MSYLGPDARDSFATYQRMYGSVSSARNYDVRANPNLFDEAVKLLELSNSFISVPSGYPSAMGQSVRDLFRARDAMYEHFKKDRELGLKDIQLKKEAKEREIKLEAERERLRLEEQKRLEAQRKAEAERRQKEQQEREARETKRYYELINNIGDTEWRLMKNINQLREDFLGAMKKQGDLFSELSSVREKDNADTIAQFNEALMENSKLEISLQQDISQLKNDTNKQNKKLTTLGKQFRDSSSKISSLSNELSFLQEKVKNINKDFIDDISVYKREQELQNKRIQGNVASIAGKVQNQRNQFERLENEQKNTHNEVFGIQKKLNDNSLMYVQDKEKILSEIENLKNGTVDFENKKAELESKLVALGEKHDAVKTELLKQLEKLQNLNQTQFDALKTENKKREDKHEKDISQLQREHDITDREVARLKNEVGIAQNAFSSLENNYENLKKSQENLTQKQTAEIVVLRQNLDPLVKKTKTLYDIYSNQQNLRRQDSIRVAPKRAKQYDAAKQFLNNYLATMFKQFG